MPLISFFTTREEEIFTTAGTTFFTTAEYPRRDAASDLGAVLTFAGGLSGCGSVAALTPRNPVTANAVVTAAVASQRRLLKRLFDIFPCHLDLRLGPATALSHTARWVGGLPSAGDRAVAGPNLKSRW